MKKIFTKNAPTPGGHYSQGIEHNGLVFVSGQLPIEPGNGRKETGRIEAQTLLVLKNIKAIVEAAGSDLSRVLKTTIYIADVDLWEKVNEVYSVFFQDHKPARAIVPTKALHFGFLIEIEAIAYT